MYDIRPCPPNALHRPVHTPTSTPAVLSDLICLACAGISSALLCYALSTEYGVPQLDSALFWPFPVPPFIFLLPLGCFSRCHSATSPYEQSRAEQCLYTPHRLVRQSPDDRRMHAQTSSPPACISTPTQFCKRHHPYHSFCT
jgi:hypothetical protein